MAEPLKTFFSPELVRRLAADIARVDPDFPSRPFITQASGGLEDLELLDRGKHIAAALAKHLPPAYPEAINVLLHSLGPEHATDELVGVGMAPFFYLELPARGRVDVATTVSVAVHTTRKPRPGRHAVDVVVNGEPLPAGAFDVVAPRP